MNLVFNITMSKINVTNDEIVKPTIITTNPMVDSIEIILLSSSPLIFEINVFGTIVCGVFLGKIVADNMCLWKHCLGNSFGKIVGDIFGHNFSLG